MNRPASVLDDGVAHDVCLPRLGVDLDVADVRAVCSARSLEIDAAGRCHRSASVAEFAGQIFETNAEFGVGLRGENTVFKLNIVGVDAPQHGGANLQLVDHLDRGVVGGVTRGVSHTAAACHRGEANGVGVDNGRVNVFGGDSECLRGLHGDRSASSANVGGAFHQLDRAVVVQRQVYRRLETDVEPVTTGKTTSSDVAGRGIAEIGIEVVGLFGCVENFLHTDTRENGAIATASAFLCRVVASELPLVEAGLFAEIVDQRLYRECDLRRTRSAVCRDLGFVHQDVVADDAHVRNVVAGVDAHAGSANERSGISTGLHAQSRIGRDQLSIFGRTEFEVDLAARGRAGALEDRAAFHNKFDRDVTGFARQHRRNRFKVDRDLATESATDLERRHADARLVDFQYRCDLLPDGECALRACPHLQAIILVPDRGCVVRLDVALVHHLKIEFTFDDVVGTGNRGIRVSELVSELLDVVRVTALLCARGVDELFQDRRHVIGDRVVDVGCCA